ncbi:MAG: hypothetical protein AAF614_33150 [Chloroflexota bacterium]
MDKRWVGLIIGIYFMLAVGYGVVNPIFEAPDEHHHYFAARHIVMTGELPQAEASHLARQEAAQPPLYYLLGAAFLAPLNLANESLPLWVNPYAQFTNETTTDNINLFVHTDAEAWPWQGDVLGVHVLRFYTTLLGLGTLLLVLASGRVVWPERPLIPLLATGLVAFLPQFLFLHSAVSNDSLIILLSTAILYQLLSLSNAGILDCGPDRDVQPTLSPTLAIHDRRYWLRFATLGITIGLAILAKMTGLALIPFACGVVFLLLWRNGRLSQLIPACLIIIGLALAVSGWLLWRNWTLYGDITAVNKFVELAGGTRPYTLRQVWHDMARVWRSLIAYFGWMTLRAPVWLYAIWVGFAGVSLAGWLYSLRSWKREAWQSWPRFLSQPLLWLSGWLALVVAAWLRFMLQTPADQGRLWFPAILSMAFLLAYGLAAWRSRWLVGGVLGLALGTAVFSLYTINQAYTRPAILPSDIPLEASAINAELGNGLTLVAANSVEETIAPTDTIHIDLYWQADAIPEQPPILEIEALGRGYESVGLRKGYHGRGQFPANLWDTGAGITADSTTLTLASDLTTPTFVRLLVRLQDGTENVEIGQIKVRQAVEEAPEPLVQMGDSLTMIRAETATTTAKAGDTIAVELGWYALAKQERPLTAFVHMGEAGQPPVAQIDTPPLAQDYPPRVWEEGDVVYDTFVLTLPPDLANGRYPLYTGLYDSETIARLPIDANGKRPPHDAYLIGWVEINN